MPETFPFESGFVAFVGVDQRCHTFRGVDIFSNRSKNPNFLSPSSQNDLNCEIELQKSKTQMPKSWERSSLTSAFTLFLSLSVNCNRIIRKETERKVSSFFWRLRIWTEFLNSGTETGLKSGNVSTQPLSLSLSSSLCWNPFLCGSRGSFHVLFLLSYFI